MKPDDDFYYRAKPAQRIALRQALSPEARGYASTYEDQMHLRGQALPDERTPAGMKWHKTVMGVTSARSIARAVKELLDHGWLVRLGDGRLTSAEVEREKAHRSAARKKGGGGSDSSSEGGGGGAPAQAVLTLIDGGKGPQAVGEKSVEEAGMPAAHPSETAELRANPARTQPELRPNLRKFPNEIKGRALSSIERVENHRVVVAVPFDAARPRDGPAARQA